ncbi:MAG: branched-chain amino acid ABC transporter permease [Candidatus Tectomicrobia bacterium]|nr:branched-chain amino acid ABC transporter permease [Candidatus Tectomicrobia bacterium]
MLLGQIVYGLVIGSIYSLIAIGFSMVFQAIGLLNFAHQEFMMLGGLIGYTLAVTLNLPAPLVVLLAGLGAGCIAVAIEKVGISPIRHRGGAEINLIIATIGWGIILSNAAMLTWDAYPLGYPQRFQGKPLNLGGISIVPQNLVILGAGILLMILLQLFFKRTWTGQSMRAAAEDSPTAALMGIDTDRTVSWTFFISGALGGIAGVFVSSIFYASFEMGLIGLRCFAAAVLGGFGNIVGAMFGGLILGIIETLGATYISSAYKDVIAYGIVIVILLIRPTGIFAARRTGLT